MEVTPSTFRSNLKDQIGNWLNSLLTTRGGTFSLSSGNYQCGVDPTDTHSRENCFSSSQMLSVYNWHGNVQGSSPSISDVVFDGEQARSIFLIDGTFGGIFKLSFMTLRNGWSTFGGGLTIQGSQSPATVDLTVVKFSNCRATSNSNYQGGGGLYISQSGVNALYTHGVWFQNCFAVSGNGGDVFNWCSTYVVDACPEQYTSHAGNNLNFYNRDNKPGTNQVVSCETSSVSTVASSNSMGMKSFFLCDPPETEEPSPVPSDSPSSIPSDSPSSIPSDSPSGFPSSIPSSAPNTSSSIKNDNDEVLVNLAGVNITKELLTNNIPGFALGISFAFVFWFVCRRRVHGDGSRVAKEKKQKKKMKKRLKDHRDASDSDDDDDRL